MKVILSVEDVIWQASASDAYQDIHPDVIRRVCESEARKGLKSRELVKAIRNRLHQIGGAYLPGNLDQVVISHELALLPHEIDSPEIQAFCRKKMELHASTKERLPIVDHFFRDILADLPPIHSVLDLACGLNPLSLPWMPIQQDTTYTALDMYRRLSLTIQTFFDHCNIRGHAAAADILTCPLDQPYDVVFLLKTLPCLEQQVKGSAAELVNRINAKTLVLSYPLCTLGGSRKGLGATYEADFNHLAVGRSWQVKRFEYANELVFLVTRS
jgi:16S rRNA (guanine(1405)-N(7))-methyltransferase